MPNYSEATEESTLNANIYLEEIFYSDGHCPAFK